MVYLLAGLMSFILFYLYDYNSVNWKNPVLHRFFMLGTVILSGTTMMLLWNYRFHIPLDTPVTYIWLAVSVVFLGLLIYTLFFAIPFNETYLRESKERKTFRGSFYGWCRHPGVLWFGGFYFSLYGLITKPIVLYVAIFYTSLNLLYVAYQDRWIFPKTFTDYDEYQDHPPFLFPKSINFMRK